MTGNVFQPEEIFSPETKAGIIASLWDSWNTQRQGWMDEARERRNFLFATDTSKTTVGNLPWKNTTTLPKLTQIRDNLHANYMSALFPNDNWLKWEAYSADAAIASKATAITAYMSNKTREDNLYKTVSQLVYDYIDYGNAFTDTKYVTEYKEDPISGEQIPQYVGPRLERIHPFSIVFNPLAESFKKSPKVVRKLKNLGELKEDALEQPNNIALQEAVVRAEELRRSSTSTAKEDTDMWNDMHVDGFGSYLEYLKSGMIEILTFEGDFFNTDTMTLEQNKRIVVADRAIVLEDGTMEQWLGSAKEHVGWRTRPENLWAMGPLDNLVGMQYRIDHLENLKADVFDLIAHPPLKIIGEVEDFTWGPGQEIHIDEGGDVQMMAPNTQALNADMQIALLEQRMEEYAGAPRQAMGIRTPGEKTAFEVSSLDNAAGRIFQNKINAFEINLIEPSMNNMLEVARRDMDLVDTVRVMDDDNGVVEFMSITKEDITAAGKLRPIGSRHFAAQAQLVQNLNQLFNGAIGQMVMPNVSTNKLTQLIEEALQLQRFGLFAENAQLFEQAERQQVASQLQEELAVQQQQPPVV